MIKSSLMGVLGFCLFLFWAGHGVEARENSCVNCHRNISPDTFVGSKYQSWKTSIHAKDGITCDRCHGGKSSADQKEAAHAGIYNSSDPLSRVYFKKVPATCGACHWRDFNAFKRSNHYALLEKTGAGPTCVTCHESHSTKIISPQELPTTCEQCHNVRMGINPQVPEHAQALLLLINETSLLVSQARKEVRAGDQNKLQQWNAAYKTMEAVRDGWHAFNLKQVQIQILKAYDLVKEFLVKKK
jgi:hypothetical protein